MFAATAFDTLAVNFGTIGFQSDSSGFMSLITYVMVVYGFVSDCLIFKETFTWVELLCAAVILIVMIYTAIVKL